MSAHAVAAACGADQPGPLADPYEAAAIEHGDDVAFMASVLEGLPRPERTLDHVPATPVTAVKRALLLVSTFELTGASVLCLGDHDLTSLALLRLRPDLDVTVVDLDDRVLEHIGAVTSAQGWTVRTVFADLRLELPRSLGARFDVVFTDPPYSPVGVRLFLARGLQALRPVETARILCCYGFGERQGALGLKVQSELVGLRLVADAILPAFNRYRGAEAIGTASALYVCRPTRRSWAAAEGAATEIGPAIYTHGSAAVQAAAAGPSPALRAVLGEVADGRPETLVGVGWPDDQAALSLASYVRDLATPRGKPPFTAPAHGRTVAVNLLPHHAGYMRRIMLQSQATRLIVITSASRARLERPVARLLAARYRLETATRPGGIEVVTAERVEPPTDPVDTVLRTLLDHPHATLGNAWREALIRNSARQLTKNEARRLIVSTGIGRTHARSYLAELPLDALTSLVPAVASTVANAG